MPGERIAEARITSKGQVTIPKRVQKILGVAKGDYLLFFHEDGRIIIVGGAVKPKR
jgi:AbrB family looped-hinge helix DNA binding protein